AYFHRENVKVSGTAVEFVRAGGSGKAFRNYFCSQCGTSVYCVSDRTPELVGVAIGVFADPNFPKPARSVFEETKHAWLGLSPENPWPHTGARESADPVAPTRKRTALKAVMVHLASLRLWMHANEPTGYAVLVRSRPW